MHKHYMYLSRSKLVVSRFLRCQVTTPCLMRSAETYGVFLLIIMLPSRPIDIFFSEPCHAFASQPHHPSQPPLGEPARAPQACAGPAPPFTRRDMTLGAYLCTAIPSSTAPPPLHPILYQRRKHAGQGIFGLGARFARKVVWDGERPAFCPCMFFWPCRYGWSREVQVAHDKRCRARLPVSS
jgi:hypothetical protein